MGRKKKTVQISDMVDGIINSYDALMIEKINDNFEPYIKYKVDDYHFKINDKQYPLYYSFLTDRQLNYVTHDGLLTELGVNDLSPDKINNKLFWKKAYDNFPFFSHTGMYKFSSIEELIGMTIQRDDDIGALKTLMSRIDENPNAKILEIGAGFGAISQFLAVNGFNDNYWGIDIIPMFKHPRLFECDGSVIPDTIPLDLDVVYSMNVFQHLSKKQRSSYYESVYNSLSDGGSFVFSNYVITPENKNTNLWGVSDLDGNKYIGFFKQVVSVDNLDDLMAELTEIGFRVSIVGKKSNYVCFHCVKPNMYE